MGLQSYLLHLMQIFQHNARRILQAISTNHKRFPSALYHRDIVQAGLLKSPSLTFGTR